MLLFLKSKLVVSDSVTIIIRSVTGGTQTDEDRARIVNIMVAVGCMQENAVAFSRSSGYPFPSVPDMAMLACPACVILTLPG